MPSPRTVVPVLALTLALAACKRAENPAPPPPSSTALAEPPAGTLFPSGVMLQGDRASLQHYLQNVDTVTGATAKITWAPSAVVFTRGAAIRSLHGASWDGVTWRFDALEPAVQRLKPGSVMMLWGLAIRRVVSVAADGDEVVVTTSDAQLTDAVSDAQIKWSAPAHVLQGAMTMRVPKPEDSVRFRAAQLEPASPFRFASFTPPDDDSSSPPANYQQSFTIKIGSYAVAVAYGAQSDDAMDYYGQFAMNENADEPVALPPDLKDLGKTAGKFADWAGKQYAADQKTGKEGQKMVKSLKNPNLSDAAAADEAEKYAEQQYEKTYGKPSRASADTKLKLPEVPKYPKGWKDIPGEMWTGLKGASAIKVTVAGTFYGFRSDGDVAIAGGKLEHASFQNPDFRVVGDLRVAGRIGAAVFSHNNKLEIPVTFRVPLIIAGLPCFYEIAVNALIQPAITGKSSTFKMARHFEFARHARLMVTAGDVGGETGDEDSTKMDQLADESMLGIGVSGLVVALQMPRIAYGFGIVGSDIKAYFDVVVSNGESYTGTTGLIQCRHSQLIAGYDVGITAQFLGMPLGDKRKTGKQWTWDWFDPPGHKCG